MSRALMFIQFGGDAFQRTERRRTGDAEVGGDQYDGDDDAHQERNDLEAAVFVAVAQFVAQPRPDELTQQRRARWS